MLVPYEPQQLGPALRQSPLPLYILSLSLSLSLSHYFSLSLPLSITLSLSLSLSPCILYILLFYMFAMFAYDHIIRWLFCHTVCLLYVMVQNYGTTLRQHPLPLNAHTHSLSLALSCSLSPYVYNANGYVCI